MVRTAMNGLGITIHSGERVEAIETGHGKTAAAVVGTAVSKVCSLEIARTGPKESECARAGFAHVTATVKSTTRAGYFPGATTITTKLIAEKRSGRLLGGQIVGEEGAAKRIDAIATALWNEMTVENMVNFDLSYAPPFAPSRC